MSDLPTEELLRRYCRDADEVAFTEIVKRFAGFVQATATRSLNGDTAAAQDVTQIVFMDLAKRARSLKGHLLGGWLYRRTQFAAADYRKAEARRRKREEKASRTETAMALSSPSNTSGALMESLDDALATLNAKDQNAIILRFFEEQSLRSVGEALGTTEDAAQKRISRAIDKLRSFFTARGVAVPAGAFLTALPLRQSEAVAPAIIQNLSKQALTAANLGATPTTITTAIMLTPQLKMLSAAVLLTAGTFLFLFINERDKRQELQAELQELRDTSRSTLNDQEASLVKAATHLGSNRSNIKEPTPDPVAEAEKREPTPEERGKNRAQKSYAELLGKMTEKFSLREDQAAQLRAFYGEREKRAAEFYGQAFAGGPIDPKFYFFEVEYWHHIPEDLQGMLDDNQIEDYQAYEVEKRINHIESFTNGELSFLQHHLDLTSEQKDGLYQPLSQVYQSETEEDLSWIQSVDAIAERKDWDNQQRREFFGDVLTEEQMEKWEEVASTYKRQKLEKYGYVAEETRSQSADGEA